jgi:sialate O-acetylesterase
LANFQQRQPEPYDNYWAELREAQLMTLAWPNTGMAVIIDIGVADDIHPTNKQDVGRRLALAVRSKAYGEDLVYSGPIYRSHEIKEGKIELVFDHVGDGLRVKEGDSFAKEGKLTGFAVAGEDKKFVWADAEIIGNSRIAVSSPKVEKPIAVRYAWADNPECNLYNSAELPASPFRTDDWPGITRDNR